MSQIGANNRTAGQVQSEVEFAPAAAYSLDFMLLRNPRAKEVQESGSGRGTRASRRARGLWKLPQPCKWEWWPSADFLLIISTAACKSLRKKRSRISHSYTQAGGDLSQ